MAATLVQIHDVNGYLHDSESHLRNAADQRLDDQGAVISDPQPVVLVSANAENDAAIAHAAVAENAQAARSKMLDNYNRSDQYYANRSAIRTHTFERHDFELNHAYFIIVGQQLYHGLP